MSQHIHTHNCGCAEEAKGLGDLYSLYANIKSDGVVALNEAVPNTGLGVIKPFDTRLDDTVTLESNSDGEVLLRVPFTSVIKLKAITVRTTGDEDRAPTRMKLWVNRDDIDFSNQEDVAPTQAFDLIYDPRGDFKIPVKPALFTSTSNITIYLGKGEDADSELCVGFLGLFGQPTTFKHGIVNVVYEARANPADYAAEDIKNKTMGYSL